MLLRVVLRTDGAVARLEPDEARRKAGRGAWVHPDLECLNLADRRSAFQRALRIRGTLESSAVHECIDRLLADRQPRQIVDPESGLETMSTQQ